MRCRAAVAWAAGTAAPAGHAARAPPAARAARRPPQRPPLRLQRPRPPARRAPPPAAGAAARPRPCAAGRPPARPAARARERGGARPPAAAHGPAAARPAAAASAAKHCITYIIYSIHNMGREPGRDRADEYYAEETFGGHVAAGRVVRFFSFLLFCFVRVLSSLPSPARARRPPPAPARGRPAGAWPHLPPGARKPGAARAPRAAQRAPPARNPGDTPPPRRPPPPPPARAQYTGPLLMVGFSLVIGCFFMATLTKAGISHAPGGAPVCRVSGATPGKGAAAAVYSNAGAGNPSH